MLISLTVKNFRSIKDSVTLDFHASSDKTMADQAISSSNMTPLLKSLAIYGANASGKSNIFKAYASIRLMILESQLRSTLSDNLPNEFFKLSSTTENKPSYFEICFIIDDETYKYGFEIDKQKIVSEHLFQDKGKKTLFNRKYQQIDSNKNYLKEATKNLKTNTNEKSLFLTVLASNNVEIAKKIIQFIQNTNIIVGTEIKSTLDYSFNQYLKNPKIAEQMKEFITKADFGVIDIKANETMLTADQVHNIPDKFKEFLLSEKSTITQRQIALIHDKYNDNKVKINPQPLDFLSEESFGTQQFFALSAPILDTLQNGKVLFIDEIDTCLHPTLSQYLISIFNSKERNPHNAQLVFTTHDLSHLKQEYLRRDQIYFTDKDDYGATELYSLSDISERKGVDFAKRYLEGRYGALPYLSDFEDLKFDKQ